MAGKNSTRKQYDTEDEEPLYKERLRVIKGIKHGNDENNELYNMMSKDSREDVAINMSPVERAASIRRENDVAITKKITDYHL